MAAADPHFRMHPELDPPEKDIHGPGLQGVQVLFYLTVCQARLQGAGSRQSPTPANQESLGEAVDREKKGGVLESAG